jgi:hypothetical protein
VTVNSDALASAPLDVDLDSSGTLRLNGGILATGSIDSHDLASQRFEGDFDWIPSELHANVIYGNVVNPGGMRKRKRPRRCAGRFQNLPRHR